METKITTTATTTMATINTITSVLLLEESEKHSLGLKTEMLT